MPGHANCYTESDQSVRSDTPPSKTLEQMLQHYDKEKDHCEEYNAKIIYQLAEFFHEGNRILVEDHPEKMISKPVEGGFKTWNQLTMLQKSGAIAKAKWIFERRNIMYAILKRY